MGLPAAVLLSVILLILGLLPSVRIVRGWWPSFGVGTVLAVVFILWLFHVI